MENLQELLGQELYDQVAPKLGENKVYLGKDGDYIPRSRLNELSEQVKYYDVQIKERDDQLKQLKETAGDKDALTAKIAELEKANTEAVEKHAKELYQRDYDTAFDKVLSEAKCIDGVALKAHLDHEKITLKDGQLSGINEQLEKLKQERAYLFESTPNPAPTKAGAKTVPGVPKPQQAEAPTAPKPWNKFRS